MSRPPRWRRWAARGALGLGLLGLVGGGSVVGLALWLRTDAGNEALKDAVLASVRDRIPGRLEVERLQTDLWSGATVHGVVLTEASGEPVARLERVDVRLDAASLLGGPIHVSSLTVEGMDARVVLGRDGSVSVLDALGLPPSFVRELPAAIEVDRAEISGRLEVDAGGYALALEALSATAALSLDGDLEVRELDASARTDRLREPVRATGGLRWDGEALSLDALTARSGASTAGLTGRVDALFGAGAFDVDIDPLSVDARDLPDLDALGLTAASEGRGRVSGSWGALLLDATLVAPTPVVLHLDADLTDTRWPLTGTVQAEPAALDGLHPAVPAGTSAGLRLTLEGALEPDTPHVDAELVASEIRALGLDLRTLTGHLALADDRLVLTEGRLSGPAGQARLNGSAAPLLAPVVHLDVDGDLDLSALTPVGLPPGLDGRTEARLVVDGPLLDTGGTVEGELSVTDLRFRGLEVPTAAIALDGTLDPRLAFTGDALLTSPRVHGRGLELVDLRAPLPVRWEPGGDLVASGTGVAREVRFAEWARSDRARATLSVQAGPDRALRARADIVLPDPHTRALTLGEVRASARLVGDRGWTTARIELPEVGAPVDVEARFDLTSDEVEVVRLVATPPGTDALPWRLAAPTTARLTGSGLEDLDLALTSGEARAQVLGRVGYDGLDLSIEVQGVPADELRDWLPAARLPALQGRVDGSLDLYGRDTLLGDGSFRAHELGVVDGPGGLEVTGVGQLRPGEISLEAGLRHGADGPYLGAAFARVPVRATPDGLTLSADRDVDIDVTVPETPLSALLPVLRSPRWERLAERLTEGTVRADLHVSGPVRTLPVEGTLDLRLRGPARAVLADLELGGQADRMSVVGSLDDPELGTLVTLDGTVRTGLPAVLRWLARDAPRPALDDPEAWVPEVDLVAAIDERPAEELFDWAGLRTDVSGTVDGQVRLRGSGARYRPTAAVAWTDGRLGPHTTVEDLALDLDPTGQLFVDALFVDERPVERGSEELRIEDGGFTIRGRLPLELRLEDGPGGWLTDPVDLLVAGRGLPLAAAEAFDPEIADPRGWLAVTGTIRGTPRAPDLDLRASLEDGELRYRQLGVRARDIDLAASVIGSELSLDHLTLETAPARRNLFRTPSDGIVVQGTGRLHDLDVVDLDILAMADRALLVSRRSQLLRLSTTEPLLVSGSARHPVVTGSFVLDQAEVDLDRGTLMEAGLWTGSPRALDPRIRLVREEGLVEREPVEERPFWAPITADLRIDLGRNLRGALAMPYLEGFGMIAAEASTIDASGQLVGIVELHTEDGEARVDGSLELVRGHARVVRSRFALDGGLVQFIDQDPFQPFVIATGSMPIETGGSVDMRIRGTPVQADARFSSATLHDADLVLAAVITGRITSTGGSSVGIASSLASSVITHAVFGDLDLGNVRYVDGAFVLDEPIGDSWRIAPQIGIANNQDTVGVGLTWFPLPEWVASAYLGTLRGSVGVTWRQRR